MVKLHFLFIALALLFGSSRAIAQTFTTLYRFTAATATNNIINNDDGANPTAGLLLSGHTLYGTTFNGGTNGAGVIFSINTDGTDYTNLRPLSYDDGAFPQSGLILLSNRLCGTTFTYGRAFNDASFGFGSVFTMNTDGTDYTVLYRFSGLDMGSTDGGYPYDYLILSGNTLFGTTVLGGSAGDGVVYKVNTDGTGYTNLHDFVGGSDGWNVESGLVLAGNTLYGTTAQGGTFDCGTIYAVNTDGTGYTNLYTFTGSSDGAYPYDRLILSSNILYGVAIYGGVNSNGTVFAINTDGTGFTILHDFTSL
ncbi:MAG: hypothetical protein JF609_00595, partial [Verrucomicrobia bacterium]|nr:hypothetical protein [Verrucomicrobiota bacterium]